MLLRPRVPNKEHVPRILSITLLFFFPKVLFRCHAGNRVIIGYDILVQLQGYDAWLQFNRVR